MTGDMGAGGVPFGGISTRSGRVGSGVGCGEDSLIGEMNVEDDGEGEGCAVGSVSPGGLAGEFRSKSVPSVVDTMDVDCDTTLDSVGCPADEGAVGICTPNADRSKSTAW